jgi:hypothetical protein
MIENPLELDRHIATKLMGWPVSGAKDLCRVYRDGKRNRTWKTWEPHHGAAAALELLVKIQEKTRQRVFIDETADGCFLVGLENLIEGTHGPSCAEESIGLAICRLAECVIKDMEETEKKEETK